jgi:hypothetical protein
MKKKAAASRCKNDAQFDERFLAATNRPQFRSSGGSSRQRRNKSKSSPDAEDKHESNESKLGNSTNKEDGEFGESLAEAMRSDNRFREALTNSEKFGCVPSMDKYGRKDGREVKKKKKKRKDDDDGKGDDDDDGGDKMEAENLTKTKGGVPIDMESRIAYLNALSRGEISASSSSDEDDIASEDDFDDASDNKSEKDDGSSTSSTGDVHGQAGVFDPAYNELPGDYIDVGAAIELTTEPTPYLCILNLDWDHTRAVDVYAMLHSFCPPGTLKRVDIYPSDFGRKMMEKELLEGPVGLWKDANEESMSGERSSGESDFDEQDDNVSEHEEEAEEEESDEEEDILNLDEATAKLYSHFPPQSAVMKNSQLQTEDEEEEGFDHEKLRAYEASKLRYYFAIATFSSPSAAETVYENVDGMEMEHSAAEIDVRALPVEHYDETIEGRKLHDSCDHLPGKYAPPDNVVTALRQSKVTCSWERGDCRREKALTRYGMGKEAWEAMAEGDDIKFYLASDNSSAGEDSDDGRGGDVETEQKSSKLRALLGLDGSDDEADEGGVCSNDDAKNAESLGTSSESDDEVVNESMTKQVTFSPGKKNLEEKIRSKLQSGVLEELTPFQKYLEKRKEKKRERRRSSRKQKQREEMGSDEEFGDDDEGMYRADPEFGLAKFSDEESVKRDGTDDGSGDDGGVFFEAVKSSNKWKKGKKSKEKVDESNTGIVNKIASAKEELELLIAGDDGRLQVICYMCVFLFNGKFSSVESDFPASSYSH